MLPEVLSADVCSLKAGEDRAAMACHMHISPQGKVTKFRFTRAIVRIAQNIAYEDAQAAIEGGTAPQYLVDLWACWQALASARQARDPLELELPERRVMLAGKGRHTEIQNREGVSRYWVGTSFILRDHVT